MDSNLGYLFAGFFVAWLILALYVWSLSGQIGALRRELDALRSGEEHDERTH